MDTKNPFLSKTVWGAIFLLVSVVLLKFFGVELTSDEQAEGVRTFVNGAEAVSAVLGFILVIWGRLTAKKKLAFGG
jgi:uncharacterized membrane protein